MSRIKNILYISLATLSLQISCGDYFDLSQNPNQISSPSLSSLLTTSTHKLGINSYTIASELSSVMQYTANPAVGSGSDVYDFSGNYSSWDRLYYAMSDLNDLIIKADTENAIHHKGIAQILMAAQLALTSDVWGAIPYSEAFGKVNTLKPKYDTEEEIYQTQNDLLDEGINNLNQTSSEILASNSDLIYGGDKQKWIKFGYALKARLLNKTSKKSTYNAQSVLTAVSNSFSSNNDNATMSTFNGTNNWAEIARQNANLVLGGWLSETFIDHLNGVKFGQEDPRIKYITDKTVNNDYKGTRNGGGNMGNLPNTVKNECYISRNSPLTGNTSPLFLTTYPEVKMIEAEAAFRANNKDRAYAAYLAAIEAHFNLLTATATETSTYLARANVAVGKDNLTLKHIFDQKFIITYLNPEAWNDLRRFDFQITGYQLPLNANLTNFPRRLEYPNSEISENGENVPESGGFLNSLWWDKP